MMNLFRERRILVTIATLFAVTLLVATTTMLSSARPPTSSITVTNNSSREVRHLYLAPADSDNWGPDQLNDATIRNGQSFTINDVACDQGSIKIVAEDQDGCFLSQIVQCSDNAVWTITNEAVANCGN